jgi:hypothetical protein
MGWRDSGIMERSSEIRIQTCDQCGKDIGTPDGYGHHAHYHIEHEPKDVYPDSITRWALCSTECLTIMAQRIAATERPHADSDDL